MLEHVPEKVLDASRRNPGRALGRPDEIAVSCTSSSQINPHSSRAPGSHGGMDHVSDAALVRPA